MHCAAGVVPLSGLEQNRPGQRVHAQRQIGEFGNRLQRKNGVKPDLQLTGCRFLSDRPDNGIARPRFGKPESRSGLFGTGVGQQRAVPDLARTLITGAHEGVAGPGCRVAPRAA